MCKFVQHGKGMWHALERTHMHSGIVMKTLKGTNWK